MGSKRSLGCCILIISTVNHGVWLCISSENNSDFLLIFSLFLIQSVAQKEPCNLSSVVMGNHECGEWWGENGVT